MFWHPRLRLLLGVYVDDFKYRELQKTLTRGGNSSPRKSVWTHQRMPDVILVVNMFSTTMSNCTNLIIHLPMFSMPVFLTSLVSQPVRPAEQGTTGSTFRVHVHHHLQPRKKFQDKPKDSDSFRAGTRRLTVWEPCQSKDEPKEFFSRHGTSKPKWACILVDGVNLLRRQTSERPNQSSCCFIVPTNSRRPTLSLILPAEWIPVLTARRRNLFHRWLRHEDLFIKTSWTILWRSFSPSLGHHARKAEAEPFQLPDKPDSNITTTSGRTTSGRRSGAGGIRSANTAKIVAGTIAEHRRAEALAFCRSSFLQEAAKQLPASTRGCSIPRHPNSVV